MKEWDGGHCTAKNSNNIHTNNATVKRSLYKYQNILKFKKICALMYALVSTMEEVVPETENCQNFSQWLSILKDYMLKVDQSFKKHKEFSLFTWFTTSNDKSRLTKNEEEKRYNKLERQSSKERQLSVIHKR
jgi:hypothetical protein